MKIMFYISTIREGGAARVMTTLANQLVIGEMAEVFLVTNFASSTDYFLDSRVQRFCIEEEERKDSFVRKNYKRVKKLREYVRSEKPDVLISFMTENDARAVIVSKLTGIKTILSVRNDPNKLFSNVAKRMLANMIYGNTDGVVFQTSDAQKWFSPKIQEKSTIIYNPISSGFYQVVREPQDGLIVSCGRLTMSKNYPLLIRAFCDVSEEFPTAVLQIYGEGKLRDELQTLIHTQNLEDKVFLMGATNDVQSVLKKADVFVLASNFEGMPNALMEAMAAGVPCISTDCPCGGPKALLENECSDLLVECGNKEALVNVLRKMLLDNDYKMKAGMRMKECAKNLSTDIIVAQWLEYIEQVCTRNR